MPTTMGDTDDAISRADGASSSPCLFRVLECLHPLSPASRHMLEDTDEVVIGRGERLIAREGSTRLTLMVPDPRISSRHARLHRVLGRWMIEDTGSRNGILRNGTLEKRAVLVDGDVLELGQTLFVFRAAVTARRGLPADLDAASLSVAAPGLASLIPSLAADFERLADIARSAVSVILHGESGTGKEVVAQAIHALSSRAGAFVPVNCGALPEALVESELFGHRKGAFSGAVEDRTGMVRSAEGGTLFLDEIGDLPLGAQAALLRALQERQVQPLGATRAIAVDFRLVAATHRNLDELVAAGDFRADLLARLSGYTLSLPPLRRRREDLQLIVAPLLRRLAPAQAERVSFSRDAGRTLLRHGWPLNVRELEKCLATALVLAKDGPIRGEHLTLSPLPVADDREPADGDADADADAEADARSTPPALSAEDAQHRQQLLALLAQHDGNVAEVARAMGKAPFQIRRWLHRFKLDAETFRRPG